MKTSDTKELALEACVERFLTGDVSKASAIEGKLQEDPVDYKTEKGAGYVRGKASDYNPEFAIDEAKFWQFLETTQGEELAKLHYKPDYKRQVLERLHRKLKKDGIFAVMKKGLAVDNAKFELLYRMPYNDLESGCGGAVRGEHAFDEIHPGLKILRI